MQQLVRIKPKSEEESDVFNPTLTCSVCLATLRIMRKNTLLIPALQTKVNATLVYVVVRLL